MNFFDYLQIIVTFLVLILAAPPLGSFIYKVYQNEDSVFKRPFRFLEKLMERILGEAYRKEMGWKDYAFAVLIFNFLGLVFTYLIQVLQRSLPLNPDQMPNVSWHSALNTAVSFMTNTNWQGYSGEATSNLHYPFWLGIIDL